MLRYMSRYADSGASGGCGGLNDMYQKPGFLGSRRAMNFDISRTVQFVWWKYSGRCQGLTM